MKLNFTHHKTRSTPYVENTLKAKQYFKLSLVFILFIMFSTIQYGQLANGQENINYRIEIDALEWTQSSGADPTWQYYTRTSSAYTNACNNSFFDNATCKSYDDNSGPHDPGSLVASGTDVNQTSQAYATFYSFDNSAFIGTNCEYDTGDSFNFCNKKTLSAKYSDPCTAHQNVSTHTHHKVTYKQEWRYNKGNSGGSALDFGTITSNTSKTHRNSNRSSSTSGLGYTNVYGDPSHNSSQSSSDVWYQFTIPANSAKRVTIRTGQSSFSDYDTYIHLLRKVPGSNSWNHIESDDDDDPTGNKSQIIRDLCANTYWVVVEGFGGSAGDFELFLDFDPAPNAAFSAGTITRPVASACTGTNIGVISGTTGSSTIFGAGSVSYEWQMNTGSGFGPTIATSRDLSMSSSGVMGTSTITYRRRVKACGAVSNWVETFISYAPSTATSGGSIALATASNTTIPAGQTPGVINSTAGGAAANGVLYQWEKKEGTGNYADINGATGLNYSVPTLSFPNSVDVKFRRKTFSNCLGNPAGNPAFSNEITISVVPTNGVIEGFVQSPAGQSQAGVPNVQITIDRIGNVPGGNLVQSQYTTTTDNNGYYKVADIYYGDSQASFTITPFKDDGVVHIFSPTNDTQLLTSSSPDPQSNIDFIDNTVFTYSGLVYQEFNTELDPNAPPVIVSCGMDTVGIYVNNIAVDSTESDGTYSITIPSIGTYTVEAKFGNGGSAHSFDPPQIMEFVDGNFAGRDFKNIETNNVAGRAGSSCNAGPLLGKALIRFTSKDGCIVVEKETESTGFYNLDLPANVYDVQLFDFTEFPTDPYGPGISELDVEAFFNGAVELDLREKDTDLSLDFIYRPPPVMRVTGWPEPLCTGGAIIAQQMEPIVLSIEIFEGVIDGCKVDTGRVIITDVISDRNDNMITLEFKDGLATYTVLPGVPNIISPYMKNLNMVARDTVGQLGQASDPYSQDVVVTGVRPRESDFATVTPELPTLILRDPPGDASFSCVEIGQTNEVTTRMYSKKANESSTWGEVKVGTEFEAGFIGFSVETEIESTIKGTLDVVDSAVNTKEYIRSISSTQKYCTSDENLVTGTSGDIFIGGAMNMLYAISDIISVDENCNVIADEDLVIKNDGFETEYIYTEKYIRDILFAKLLNLQENAPTPDSAEWYGMQYDVWEQVLQRNEELKMNALPWETNKSISSNAPYTSTSTATTTESLTLEFVMEINEAVATAAGVEIAGVGASGGVNINMKVETGESEENTSLQSFTTEYHLEDNNGGAGFATDGFSVDILIDPVYKTPVFNFVAGNTSCPWEAGSQPRDAPRLTAMNPVVSNIAQGQVGEFTLLLENISESEEARTYYLQLDPSSNPNNAQVTVGGVPFGQGPGLPYPLAYLQSFPLDISVAQGTSTVFSYEGLRFRLYPLCEAGADGSPAELASEATISAFFESPCSDVSLFDPVNGWEINSSSSMIDVHIKGYTKSQLDQIQIEYTPSGSSNFQTAMVVQSGDLNNNNANGSNLGTVVPVDFTNIDDGEYDIRLKLVCGSSSIFSERASGIIDRQGPSVLGLPEPTDDDYESGDDISVEFDEEISCDPVNTTVEVLNLVTGNPVSAVVQCIGNKAIVTTLGTPLADQGDAIYQVTIFNIEDMYGNNTAETTWDFRVGEYVYVCAPFLQDNNDVCANAVPITCGETVISGNNCAAEIDLPDCAGNPAGTYTFKGLWYSFVGDGNDMTLSSCDNADFLSVIMVYEGVCGSISCYAATQGTCNGLGTEVTFSTTSGNTYYVAIAGFNTTDVGDFEMTLNCAEPACPPSLDLNNNPELGGIYTSESYISSASTINTTGGNVSYSAGDNVSMIAGFNVESGAEFDAYIEGCGSVFVREGNPTSKNPLGGSKRD